MDEIKLTGGARIGRSNATWPFATLTVTKDKLELNATILGKFVFLSGDIVSFDTLNSIGKYNGVRIYHIVPGYNEKVVFWTPKPAQLIQQIHATGFISNTGIPSANSPERKLQAAGGFPLRKSAAIIAVVVWNVLFISGIASIILTNGNMKLFQLAASAALALLIMFSLLTMFSKSFAAKVLKEGREVSDIKKFLIFLIIIAAFMLVNFTFLAAAFSEPY
ncbi:hypothetical protein FMM05_03995 [Flavobacterium zepuense]|uniref:Uncharacterized protein n=1 Tax=Flavobacterium zepuense TaxID=2593302 RepID=A0A552V7X4_9FLAO|nr:hypothetical protein [Flavobacterium zepuense]TRW26548.1 hypothetical protein FMM05_03995 [Flavobacterium zepuense]